MRVASVVGVIGVVVIALALVACTASGPSPATGSLAVPETDSPSASVGSAPSSTAASSASTGPYTYAHYPATDYPAGTYATTSFEPAFTAVIDTDLGLRYGGDLERFIFVGQDKNAQVNADEEWDVMYLDRVLDAVGQRTIDDLEGDPLDWLERHPRFDVVSASAIEFEVDGHPARQLDLLPADPVQCGSNHADLQCVMVGWGPADDEPFVVFAGSRFRAVVVDVDGTPILFTYQATDDERFADRSGVFDRWIRSIDFQ
jgi:hypothetical protein